MTKTILLVVQEPEERRRISEGLIQEAFEVIPVEDGFSALEKLEKLQPDLFLMDLKLTGLNGLEICHILKERPQYATTPVFLLADQENPLTREAERAAVSDRIITKPVDTPLLVKTVREFFGLDKKGMEEVLPETIGDESVRIEELLGWQISAAPAEARKGIQVSSPEGRVEEALNTLWEGEGIDSLIRMEPLERPSPPHEAEKPISLPSSSAPTLPEITREMVEEVIAKKAHQIIEKVVWEVVPRLAEIEIKKEIERLKSE